MPKIAVVDDNRTNRSALKRLAATITSEAKIVAFACPHRALEHIAANPVDLLVTEFGMRDMNGDALIAAVRAIDACATLPIIVVTARRDRDCCYRPLDAGATDFLTHPVDRREFVARAGNLLELSRLQNLALRTEHELVEAVFANLEQGLCVIGADLRINVFNQRFITLVPEVAEACRVGADIRDLTRRNAAIVADRDPDAEKRAEWSIAKLEAGEPYEYTRETRDGRTIDVRVRRAPAGRFVASVTDITENVQQRREAEEKTKLLEQTFEHMGQGICVVNPDLTIRSFNRRVIELIPDAEDYYVVGADIRDVVRRNAEKNIYNEADRKRIAEWQIAKFEAREAYRAERRAGARTIDMMVSPTPEGGLIATFTDISDIKATEAALHESEARFRDFVASATDWVWETDAELKFTFVSDGLAEHAAISPDRLIGKTIWEVAQADPDDPVWVGHLAVHDAREPYRDFRFTTKDGDGALQHWRVSGKPVFDDIGCFTGYRGTGTNETLEVETRTRAEAAESRLRDAIEAIPDGFVIFDEDDRLVTCNQRYRDMYGRSGDAIKPGARFTDILRHGLKNGQYIEAVGREEEWFEERLRLYRQTHEAEEQNLADGRWLRIEDRRTDDGGTVGIRTDITDMKRRETELAEKSRLLENTFNNMAQGLIVIDADLKVTASNDQAAKLLDLPEALFEPGADFSRIVLSLAQTVNGDATDPRADIEGLRKTMRRGGRSEVVRKIGRGRSISIRINVQDDGTGVITFTDITVRAAAEERLHHGQKLEALGQLAGGVSHEFNNLLTSIVGFARMALKKPEDTDRVLDCLHEVAEVGDRAIDLTRQMLTFSNKQVMPPSVVRIGEVVAGMDKLLKAFIEESVDLTVEILDRQSCAEVDPARLTQCVVNLVSNARHAMPEGGRLIVRCDRTAMASTMVTSHGADLPKGRYVRIAVSDTGTGIEPQTLSKIFDPFFTTKEKGKGTGLGLSLVYGMIKNFGGAIDVESQVGIGTTFTIFLPIVDKSPDADDAKAKVDAPTMPAVPTRKTVLVVEDDPHVRRFARTSLEDCGYRVIEADDGEQAQDVYKEHQDAIELLVTDVIMPKVGGIELAKALTERQPDLKVIYMSGYAPELDGRLDSLEAGSRFLKKPFEPDALGQMARDALAD